MILRCSIKIIIFYFLEFFVFVQKRRIANIHTPIFAVGRNAPRGGAAYRKLKYMNIVKMQFSRCEAMTDTGSVRIELKSVIDLSNPLALLQSGGAVTAGFFVRHVLDGKNEQQVAQVLQTLAKAFESHTFDVKRMTIPVSYLSDGKGNAVQVTRADGTTQNLSSLVFNSVQADDTDETMLAAAKVSFANAVMSGRYVLTTSQPQNGNGAQGAQGANTNQSQQKPNLAGDFDF